jgi:hypothetical protein
MRVEVELLARKNRRMRRRRSNENVRAIHAGNQRTKRCLRSAGEQDARTALILLAKDRQRARNQRKDLIASNTERNARGRIESDI